MGVYDALLEMKTKGEKLRLEELSPKDLKSMFIDDAITDSMIADLYEVKKTKITYMRKKHGITVRNSILEEYLLGKTESTREMNMLTKKEILTKANINMISKAVTHFAFRNGPIEDMHAHPNNQLSETDMKTLNKFMINRLAYIFTLIIEERWIEFSFLIRTNDMMFGKDWDEAEPDDGSTKEIIEMILKDNYQKRKNGRV
ncbi:hypothetical protein HSX37_12660|uniref:Uncharacterized protein n=1 Tax=Dendrosporobacter quercicolus TaxID=146817 RepID=A0A1G9TQG2_9FIRM|nr:hypothetical protein [Dendrosporobacter quercicolus]NSL48886.1 hypothetical protein [Dendrosporobacter quercicolus DSM 1736]SDM49930.1 hypothetical protein SAMN04488502_10552 [Dendrosporobacter quercicolus]